MYGEGLYIGYRHYDRAKVAPLFPFGHGLSYTTFEYGRPSLSSKVLTPGGTIELTVAVSNVGDVAGLETVQIYVRDEKSRLPRPEKELVAFEKVALDAGETKHLRIPLDKYAVGYYDTAIRRWIAEEGTFTALVAASAADIKYVWIPRFCGLEDLRVADVALFFVQVLCLVRGQGVVYVGFLIGRSLGCSGCCMEPSRVLLPYRAPPPYLGCAAAVCVLNRPGTYLVVHTTTPHWLNSSSSVRPHSW